MFQRVRIRVPATTANLGAGFDVVGLALDCSNTVELRVDDTDRVTVDGCDASSIPCDGSNYVVLAARRIFEHAGVDTPPLAIHIEQHVPVGSGLGSSAAALVAGAVGANALLDNPLDDDAVIRILAAIEGHAEQVAAGVLGGGVATIPVDDDVLLIPLPVHPSLCFALVTPDTRLSAKEARAVLPSIVSFADAVTQAASAFALAPGLASANTELLAAGTRDQIHQDPRASLLPSAPHALAAARDAGALAACWSGAGPTMLGIYNDDAVAEKVVAAMRDAFDADDVASSAQVCRLDLDGATVVARD